MRRDGPEARKRVVLLDDELPLLRALSRSLARHCDITTFSDAVSALDWLATSPGPIDLILCDVHLPGVDGPMFRARLAAERPGMETLVVFVSGEFPHDRILPSFGSLPNRCVGKPFNRQLLLSLLDETEPRVA